LSSRWGLVLGGGGVLGGAWMVGALTALQQLHGLDPRDAELIVGTSAGSVTAAVTNARWCARSLDMSTPSKKPDSSGSSRTRW